ncbi:MAG: glycosyltransferase [Paraprevotella sp.]|nr:glycosyltransferase [Paraprevotella sp.]
MKLTIIVPVYKVEAYLDFCLKSIARQDVADSEIILVDDCSPDRCGAICDEWARKDPRFRVLHNLKNEGLSTARNRGLDIAQGEYITFIDSDDYLSPETLRPNMEQLEMHPEADVLEYPVCVYHGTEQAYRYVPGHHETLSYSEWIRQKGYQHSYAWNKIYRRSLWKTNRFPKGKWFEDVFTIPFVLQQARGILRTDRGLYFYCCRKGSISNTLCSKSINDLLQAHLQLYNTLSHNSDLSEKDLDDFYLGLCNPQIVHIQFGGSLYIPERRIPLCRALFTRRPLNYRIKAVLKALSGDKYCSIVARTRKALNK